MWCSNPTLFICVVNPLCKPAQSLDHFSVPLHHIPQEQTALVQLTKRHKSGQQLVLRAQIVLAAGEVVLQKRGRKKLNVSDPFQFS